MKLNTKKVIYVGLAFMIICMFWQVYDNVISKMLINSFGLNQTWSGVVMALDNILALFMLPLFGALSDKTKTKYGKRTPYIFFGVIISAIFLVGVSVFDNMQNNKLDDIDASYVVKIEDKIFDEKNEYNYLVKDFDKDELLNSQGGYYMYNFEFTKENIDKYFDFTDMTAEEIADTVRLSDTELSDQMFEVALSYLNEDDKEEFKDILESKEKRLEIEVTSSKSLIATLTGGEATNTYTRKNLDRIEALELRIAERILEKYEGEEDSLKELLYSFGIKKFYAEKEVATQIRGKVAWDYTKNNIGYLIGFLFILLLVLVAMATYRTPAVSLMPDVTIKPLRSKANAIINLMGTVGGIIALGLMSFLAVDYHSYMLLFIVIGLIMIGTLAVFLWKVKEPELVNIKEKEEKLYCAEDEEEELSDDAKSMPKDVKKSFYLIILSIIFWFMAYNAATTKFSVYAGDVLNMGYTIPLLIANATALISYIPIGIIASKVGRKKTIIVGVIILFVAFFLGCIATEKTKVLLYFTMGLAGIGWATINVNSYPMVVEMSKGSNVGKYTGYYYTASMFAQIITPVLSGVFMDLAGTMRVLFPYSCVFCVLAFCTMIFVKHGDYKPETKKGLEALDVDD